MGDMNWTAVFLAALTFFAVGAVWYGPLFGKLKQRETGIARATQGADVARIMGLTFLAELVVCMMLGHNIARTNPPDHVIMMMATGFALTIMIPAIGITYLHQRKSLTLFLIDAGHFLAGMSAAGVVFLLMR